MRYQVLFSLYLSYLNLWIDYFNHFGKLIAINSLNITYPLFSPPLLLGLHLHVLFGMFHIALICFCIIFLSILLLGYFLLACFPIPKKNTIESPDHIIFYQKGFPLSDNSENSY